jgi:intein/homing endonuclease
MPNKQYKIPKNVYENSDEQIKFLRDLFDEGGYIRVRIRTRGKKKSKIRNLRMISNDKFFIKKVQYFLQKQGIRSVIYPIGKTNFCLDIEGKQRLETFLKKIGFSDESKLKKLQEALKPLSLSEHEESV